MASPMNTPADYAHRTRERWRDPLLAQRFGLKRAGAFKRAWLIEDLQEVPAMLVASVTASPIKRGDTQGLLEVMPRVSPLRVLPAPAA